MASPRPLAISVSSPGKAVLMGEDSVPVGLPALLTGLDLRTHLVLREAPMEHFIHVVLPDVGVDHVYDHEDLREGFLDEPPPLRGSSSTHQYNWEHPELLDVPQVVAQVSVFLGTIQRAVPLQRPQHNSLLAFFLLYKGMFCACALPLIPFSVKVTAELPIGRGTGSSASYCACLAAAFLYLIRHKAAAAQRVIAKKGYRTAKAPKLALLGDEERDLVRRWCLVCERLFHDDNTGAAAAIACMGGLVRFGTNTFRHLVRSMELNALLVDTGYSEEAEQAPWLGGFPLVARNLQASFLAITEAAEEVVLRLAECHDEPQTLELSVEIEFEAAKLNELVRLARNLSLPLPPDIEALALDIEREFGLETKRLSWRNTGYSLVLLPPDLASSQVMRLKEFLKQRGLRYFHTVLGGAGAVVDEL